MTSPRRTSSRSRVALVLAVPALLLAGGCGLDEESQNVADEIRTAISSGDDSEEARNLAECTADRWVGEAGIDRLREDGIVTGEEDVVVDNVRATTSGNRPVSEQTARDYARARVSCLDFDVESQDSEETFPGASDDDRDDYADCLKDIDTDLRVEALTQTTLGNNQAGAVRRLGRQVSRCQESLL